jgi:dipeptidyl aminopeptidase/acylaminoacyl peptidase
VQNLNYRAGRSVLLLVLACTLTTPVPLPAAQLDIYGHLPTLEDIALSPDGSRVAFVKTQGETRLIEAWSLADHKVLGAARVGDQKLRGIRWADNDHLMVTTSAAGAILGISTVLNEWRQLQIWDVKTHRMRPVPQSSPTSGVNMLNVIAGEPMVRQWEGHTSIFVPVITISTAGGPALERIDLDGVEKQVTQGGSATREWLVDSQGKIAADMTYDDMGQRWSIRVSRNGRMQEGVSGKEAVDVPRLVGFDAKGENIVYQQLENKEWVWHVLSLKDGTVGVMPEAEGLRAPITQQQRVIGGVKESGGYVFFDPGMQYRWDNVRKNFEGERTSLVSLDADMLRFVMRVDGPTHGYLYELVDMGTNKIEPLGDIYAGGIKPYEVRHITYEAADGLQIPAFLTLPRGRAEHDLPLVVLPHGGPQVLDTADFDWWSQALADQGYAVLRPNYRGSDLSPKFVEAGYGEWGRKMQTDLSDGVRYLAKQGIIDPKRVCIVGASYGGYAALAGATLDPGVYRCAVSDAGLSDLSLMLTWVEQRGGYGPQRVERYWDRFMGAKSPHDPALDAISPIKHIAAITAPVLLIHGKDDTVVPYRQSEVMLEAMRQANKSVQLVTLNHEDHWLSRGDTRTQMLQATVTFLREHNPPDQ